MLAEVLRCLAVRADGVYVDATLGGGGYAQAMLQAGAGRVIGLDWDQAAVARATDRLATFGSRVVLMNLGFQELGRAMAEAGIERIDGVAADLGLSSDQLADPERGFSFQSAGPLDMRMDTRRRRTAAELVNGLDQRELKDLFRQFGEEPRAGLAAKAIARARREEPIEDTARLAAILERALGGPRPARIHPATRVFQALRIAVNGELDNLTDFLSQLPDRLAPGGRAVVVSYHSLEDRLVKEAFRAGVKGCVCPPGKPCVCQIRPVYRALTTKPATPEEAETADNPRARSAKLRAVERL